MPGAVAVRLVVGAQHRRGGLPTRAWRYVSMVNGPQRSAITASVARRELESLPLARREQASVPDRVLPTCAPGAARGSRSGPRRTSAMRPGADGAADGHSRLRRARRRQSQEEAAGSSRPTGCNSPATDERPMASGSAKVTASSEIVSGCHRARAPTWAIVETQASTSAISSRSPEVEVVTRRSFWRRRQLRPAPPQRHQARGEPRDRRLAEVGEDVVGTRREGSERDGAAAARPRAVGAVAAEHDDHRGALGHHADRPPPACRGRVSSLRVSSTSNSGHTTSGDAGKRSRARGARRHRCR